MTAQRYEVGRANIEINFDGLFPHLLEIRTESGERLRITVDEAVLAGYLRPIDWPAAQVFS